MKYMSPNLTILPGRAFSNYTEFIFVTSTVVDQYLRWFYESLVPRSSSEDSPQDGAWQAELVKRSLDGDEQAFAQIIDHYGSLLLRTAYLIVNDQDIAQDIVQDTFILAWKKLSTLKERTFLRAWLLKITVNQAVGFKRQLALRTKIVQEQVLHSVLINPVASIDPKHDNIEETFDLQMAINLLPTNQRVVIVLAYYHHMSMPEISHNLGIAENTLRKRLQSGLEKLRRVLSAQAAGIPDTNLEAQFFYSRIGVHKGKVS